MSEEDFTAVQLKEFTAEVSSDDRTLTVVMLGESIDAAKEQMVKLASHLSEKHGKDFVAGEVSEMSNTTVTFTEVAWQSLVSSMEKTNAAEPEDSK